MEKNELRPCPFCGEKLEIEMDDTSSQLNGHDPDCWLSAADDSWGVCGINAKDYSARKKHIAEVWNRRYTLEQKQPQGEICSNNICDYCDNPANDDLDYCPGCSEDGDLFHGRKLFTGE